MPSPLHPIKAFADTWETLVTTYPAGVIETGLTAFVTVFALIIPSTLFLLLDTTFPSQTQRHKKQPQTKRPQGKSLLKCLALVSLNTTLAISTVAISKLILGWSFSPFNTSPLLPSFTRLTLDLIYATLCREIIVYYIHRISHWPWLYRHIHKVHHEFQAPIGFVAAYEHPLESFVNGGFPVYAPLAMRGAHMVSYGVFFFAVVFYVVLDHTGYEFWWLPNASAHDLHHERGNCNFGTVGLMDWVHGTGVDGVSVRRGAVGIGMGKGKRKGEVYKMK